MEKVNFLKLREAFPIEAANSCDLLPKPAVSNGLIVV